MVDPTLEATVGMSRKWDAKQAGREVAENAIKKLNRPPSLFLLYSTIHYKKMGGFNKFLDGVWDVLPKDTHLVGGTVASFINNYGCYSRGATALAISYPNMDTAIGLGKNTKLKPKSADKNCASAIKSNLKNSKYPNKILINMISSPTVPNIPFMGRGNIIKSKFFGWFASTVGIRIFPILGHGLGKEDDLVDELGRQLKDYYIIGGSSVDSGKYFFNYQFAGKQVFTNSIVAIGCSVDLPIFLQSFLGVHETDKKFTITDTMYNDRIIKTINNKPAKKQFLDLLDITEEQFDNLEVFYSRTANYFPITFEENKNYTTGTAGFFGDNIVLGYKSRGKHAQILSITGKEILDSIDKFFSTNDGKKLPFVFMSNSFIFLNTLGNYSHIVKKKLDDHIKDVPYVVIFPTAENSGTPNNGAINRVYSFNAFSLKYPS